MTKPAHPLTRRLAYLLIGGASLIATQAAELVTATITITNNPVGNTNTITIGAGAARSWTNDISAAPSTLINETNNTLNAATNLLNHLTQYPQSFAHALSKTSPTNVLLRGAVGEALSITAAGGWASVTYSTQTVSSAAVVRMPITVETATNRTNIASWIVQALDYSTTALSTNSPAGTNYLSKGASVAQTVISPVQFRGRTAINSNFFATNGFTKSITNIDEVSSNSVNFGNAFRSDGDGGVSLQLGSNALARSLRSIAIGAGALATNTDSVAIGTAATATNQSATALGNAAAALGAFSTAIGQASSATNYGTALGQGATASGDTAIAIGISAVASDQRTVALGPETAASGYGALAIGDASVAFSYKSTALGSGASASHSNATAIGYGSATTRTNEIVLGTSSDRITVPGKLENVLSTNSTWKGTNILNGGLILTTRANTGLANGNNSGVVLGTNVTVDLSGGSTIASIAGFAAEPGDSFHIVRISGAVTNIILNDSGVDATAANRIITGTGGDINLTNNPSYIELRYHAASSRWNLVNWTR